MTANLIHPAELERTLQARADMARATQRKSHRSPQKNGRSREHQPVDHANRSGTDTRHAAWYQTSLFTDFQRGDAGTLSCN